ncbi:MBL fold metallo-hydrolase [Arthrobacter sp. AL08]|uniref:MBL fold metallo-hydrolase n=1 Tax=Micrococcaceae TaxID=1268 RepID=UPI001D000310|nr:MULTISPECIES: MBL fold metallo-hydrolase [Micrococcaceae]MCB5281681.1 Hydroxyacylglutathione hydrolase [Arthrobacter sp. ES1]MDI3241917.1 MBL fold metallo-hydrolase [Arthrobacter sp. AL05]MDI3277759.1 MBL fold metallo-hydrolase [Arthrobacter sp. AL08]MDJ0351869.1 MBL fold metallo-hydrolase [Pseudarthrobacter sp. PH31-O2]WGZ81010.1 MBL fold metallo-hydrolase [Arthrobacter sp. EM1]
MTELDLDVRWYEGTRSRPSRTAPPIQVHRAAPNTIVLRQNITDNFEAPFLYLLFGDERAFLLDTGATADPTRFPLRATVDTLIDRWLHEHPHDGYELVVAHSHAHGDHIAADGQFTGRHRTRLVGHSAEHVAAFFGIHDWPHGTARFDLGGRILELIPVPGHHPSAIAVYDEDTGILLTGDTVYPGRLYVQDFPAFQHSLRTLCDFAAAHPVAAVLGAHIEMPARPFRDFPLGSTWHPDEAPLPLAAGTLQAIRDATLLNDRPGAQRHANFIIWNGPCRRESVAQSVRLLLSRALGRGLGR